MYDTNLTRISLPNNKEFIYHLGVAISVFMSVNGFLIENILHTDNTKSWYKLIDKTSGNLSSDVKETITANSNAEIAQRFNDCISKRNRILHGFRVTDGNQKQAIYTKDSKNNQYEIDDKFLINFITECSELDNLLYKYRYEKGFV